MAVKVSNKLRPHSMVKRKTMKKRPTKIKLKWPQKHPSQSLMPDEHTNQESYIPVTNVQNLSNFPSEDAVSSPNFHSAENLEIESGVQVQSQHNAAEESSKNNADNVSYFGDDESFHSQSVTPSPMSKTQLEPNMQMLFNTGTSGEIPTTVTPIIEPSLDDRHCITTTTNVTHHPILKHLQTLMMPLPNFPSIRLPFLQSPAAQFLNNFIPQPNSAVDSQSNWQMPPLTGIRYPARIQTEGSAFRRLPSRLGMPTPVLIEPHISPPFMIRHDSQWDGCPPQLELRPIAIRRYPSPLAQIFTDSMSSPLDIQHDDAPQVMGGEYPHHSAMLSPALDTSPTFSMQPILTTKPRGTNASPDICDNSKRRKKNSDQSHRAPPLKSKTTTDLPVSVKSPRVLRSHTRDLPNNDSHSIPIVNDVENPPAVATPTSVCRPEAGISINSTGPSRGDKLLITPKQTAQNQDDELDVWGFKPVPQQLQDTLHKFIEENPNDGGAYLKNLEFERAYLKEKLNKVPNFGRDELTTLHNSALVRENADRNFSMKVNLYKHIYAQEAKERMASLIDGMLMNKGPISGKFWEQEFKFRLKDFLDNFDPPKYQFSPDNSAPEKFHNAQDYFTINKILGEICGSNVENLDIEESSKQCYVCFQNNRGNLFYTGKAIYNHFRNAHSLEGSPTLCILCQMLLSSESNLHNHLIKKHGEEGRDVLNKILDVQTISRRTPKQANPKNSKRRKGTTKSASESHYKPELDPVSDEEKTTPGPSQDK